MQRIEDIVPAIHDIAERYGLKLRHIDFTDITLIARIDFSFEVFVQIYANTKKDKLNMSLVVAEDRIYGIDKEGGFYHEHPFRNPSLHIETKQMSIEDFVMNSLEILKKINLM
ncbi:MAG: hypothetical protein A2X54_06350 [Nitrospirae bacterium GWF2_44_13]|nr:MAG: hypothetical protein A2X54_06350 [Nitrospirae bacterium GWF2_44_13]OGW31852.1 MAG: hypothetical protein A2088_02000 [Nitrospirae bacterium GWD2_44_7]OGW64945.1 MAG: hypothetical protein A2222_04855 [Nitrospirae bacterium RIFOXYA2_FULL_44_9]OGW73368.1 MAG: hypothetical protein A2484_09105 [Nitrospirae bacterium RIFOXYC2_FULL_44_7]